MISTRAVRGVLLLIPIVAVGLTACGSSDDTTTSADATAQTLTAAEWEDEVNGICRKTAAANRDQFATTLGQGSTPDPAAVATLFTQLSGAVRGAIDEIAALEPPPELQAQADAIVENGNAEVDRLDAAVSDPAVLKQSLKDGVFPKLYQSMADAGLDECASATSPENFGVALKG